VSIHLTIFAWHVLGLSKEGRPRAIIAPIKDARSYGEKPTRTACSGAVQRQRRTGQFDFDFGNGGQPLTFMPMEGRMAAAAATKNQICVHSGQKEVYMGLRYAPNFPTFIPRPISPHTVLINSYNMSPVRVPPPVQSVGPIALLTHPPLLHLQITQNPVNQANCGSSSCNCGDRWVSAFDGLKAHVLTSFQLPVQTRGMQVLNGHDNMAYHDVCTLERKFCRSAAVRVGTRIYVLARL
jgi:hypothetical protein